MSHIPRARTDIDMLVITHHYVSSRFLLCVRRLARLFYPKAPPSRNKMTMLIRDVTHTHDGACRRRARVKPPLKPRRRDAGRRRRRRVKLRRRARRRRVVVVRRRLQRNKMNHASHPPTPRRAPRRFSTRRGRTRESVGLSTT